MSTRIIQDYFSTDPQVRAAARRALVEQYREGVQSRGLAVRSRFGHIVDDVVQEAWQRCFAALDAEKDALLQPRLQRPSTGGLWSKHSKRALETLQQRERRLAARKAPVEQLADRGTRPDPRAQASLTLTPREYREVLEGCWQRVLSLSTAPARAQLTEIEMLPVYDGDWELKFQQLPVEEEAARTLTQLVVETREVMRNELRPMLAARGLTPEAIETFVKTVLPGGKPKRRR